MKKHFCFSAIVCVFVSVFVFSADAIYSQIEKNAKTVQDDYKTLAQNRNMEVIKARGLMETLKGKYSENLKDIQKGKKRVLSTVFTGASALAVTYVSGGSTVTVMVPYAIKTAVESLNLAGSINVNTGLESAFESAISELQSRIGATDSAIYLYSLTWADYGRIVRDHNSQYHGSDSSPSDPPHRVSTYQPPELDDSLPSFSCPDGSCGLTWTMPSSARTAHFAKCGTSDDPYNKTLRGCSEVFYTCNTTELSRHQPKPCGLKRWTQTTHGWSKVACGSDYRACSQNQQLHATVLGTNQISLCGPASSSSPIVSPTPTPTDGTPNCSDCTTHCSPPCLCSNSGTCNGTVSYHACGVHETTVSGDHSLQASCSSTDANGNSCTVTNFYACDNHSHVYPPPPPPPTPTLVTCSACNVPYDPNNTSAVNLHRVRTCRFSECRQTWQRCQNSAPICNKPYRKRNGLSCSAE